MITAHLSVANTGNQADYHSNLVLGLLDSRVAADDTQRCDCCILTFQVPLRYRIATLNKAAAEQPGFQAIFTKFAQHEFQTAEELALALWNGTNSREQNSNDWWSTKPLRDCPIYRDSWERATIIDARFWEEKSAVGPLFLIIKDASSRNAA